MRTSNKPPPDIDRSLNGFSLIEVLVSLTLAAIIGVAAFRAFSSIRQSYLGQLDRIRVQSELRIGAAIVESEVRGLDTTDPGGSDIVSMDGNSIVYNAMRVLGFLCRPAEAGASEVLVFRDGLEGWRGFEPESDSLLVYRGDGIWGRHDVLTAGSGPPCPVGGPSIALGLSPPIPSPSPVGSPVRAFELARLRLYRSGGHWLGANRYLKGSGWTITQPLVGPLTSDGFELTYHDTGGIASGPEGVRRIVFRIETAPGRWRTGADSLAVSVALKNSGGQ